MASHSSNLMVGGEIQPGKEVGRYCQGGRWRDTAREGGGEQGEDSCHPKNCIIIILYFMTPLMTVLDHLENIPHHQGLKKAAALFLKLAWTVNLTLSVYYGFSSFDC